MATLLKYVRIAAVTALLCGVLLSAGCRSKQKPDPSMTAVRGGGPGSADWVNPEDVAGAGSLGLSERDPSLTGEGNRIENLFTPVYFDFDQSFIRPDDRPNLQNVAAHMAANPADKLLVEGHCDWRGTTEYNMALGDRRATSVTDYLGQLGVPADRMGTLSKGDLEAVTEGSETEMQQDRRADLIIIR